MENNNLNSNNILCNICYNEYYYTNMIKCDYKDCQALCLDCLNLSFLSFMSPLCPFCKNEFNIFQLIKHKNLFSNVKELITKKIEREQFDLMLQESEKYDINKVQIQEFDTKEIELKTKYFNLIKYKDNNEFYYLEFRNLGQEINELFLNKKKHQTTLIEKELIRVLTNCDNIKCKGKIIEKNNEAYCFMCKEKYCHICNQKICNPNIFPTSKDLKNQDTSKDLKNQDIHICKNEDIKEAEKLKKTTKACPNCNSLIEKTVGCDHMFCTICNKKFDWKTNKIIYTSRIMNPEESHIFENKDYIYEPTLDDFENNKIFSILKIIFSQNNLNNYYLINNKFINYETFILNIEKCYNSFISTYNSYKFDIRQKYFLKLLSSEKFELNCWKFYFLDLLVSELNKFMLYLINKILDYHRNPENIKKPISRELKKKIIKSLENRKLILYDHLGSVKLFYDYLEDHINNYKYNHVLKKCYILLVNNIEDKKEIKINFDLKLLFGNNLGIKRYLKNNSL